MARILLITADTALACALTARLSRTGHDAQHCPSGRSGLARARQWMPELIALDAALPGMNGLMVLKWLRDVPWLLKVPVMVLIERTLERETLKECLFWGAAGYIEKDLCSIQEMAATLETSLRLSRSSPSATGDAGDREPAESTTHPKTALGSGFGAVGSGPRDFGF